MGTKHGRREFRRSFDAATQGLFIFADPKRVPRELPAVNIGKALSAELAKIARPAEPRSRRNACRIASKPTAI